MVPWRGRSDSRDPLIPGSKQAVLSLRVIGAFVLAACGGAPNPVRPPQDTTPAPPPVLIWQDEFDGPAGATFDRAKWAADTGGSGFGNQERQFYTTRTENVAIDRNGNLGGTALAEPA